MKEEIQKTKEKMHLEAIHIAHALRQTVGENNDYYITLEQLNEVLKNGCPNYCTYEQPYGFVPEAGCIVHD